MVMLRNCKKYHVGRAEYISSRGRKAEPGMAAEGPTASQTRGARLLPMIVRLCLGRVYCFSEGTWRLPL